MDNFSGPAGATAGGGQQLVTDMPTISMIAPPDPFGIAPMGPEAILDPLGDMDRRITVLEGAVATLNGNIDLRLPAIDRMLGIEGDIRVLLDQLAQLADTRPPAAAAAPDLAPAPAPGGALPALGAIGPPGPATEAAPAPEAGPIIALAPIEAPAPDAPAAAPAQELPDLAPVAEPELAGVAEPEPPVAAAPPVPLLLAPPPPTPAAAPAPAAATPLALAPAPSPAPAAPLALAPAPALVALAPTGDLQRGLHLASYRQRSSAENGWAELRSAHSNVLAGLPYRVTELDVPGQGIFFRLVAGPFPDPDAADQACRAIKARGNFCEVVAFDSP